MPGTRAAPPAAAQPSAPPLRRSLRLSRPLDLPLTLSALRSSGADRTIRLAPSQAWRATRTPAGAATLLITVEGTREVCAQAWGPGAEAALDGLPALLGEDDDERGFVARHRVVADLRLRLRGMRLPRTGAVFEALVPAILAQRVTTGEAHQGAARLALHAGDPAPEAPPCPPGLRLPPSPDGVLRIPSWDFHRMGIERQRADTLRRAAAVAARLEETVAMPRDAALQRLRLVPGIGPWTAAKVAIVAFGDPDAVPLGDYNLPHAVSWALAGEPRGSDERMLELLEPYRGHRARVLRLLIAGGVHQPRFGPRRAPRNIATM